ncbi:AsmA family protein [Litorivicinus sp.]|nr:AsmA family protein [Litorivicinus sp.]
MRIFKALLILIMISIVAVMASVAYITQVLDPNDLKPTLIETAKKQQISLNLDGNIAWTFWPWFGITVENVRANSANWTFEANQLEGSLSILSILSDTIVIDELTAMSPKVRFDLSKSSNGDSHAKESSEISNRTVLIRQLVIQSGAIEGLYPGLSLNRLNLSVDSLSPETASRLELETYIGWDEKQAPLKINARIIPTVTFDGLTIRDLELQSRDLKLDYAGYLSASKSGQFSGEGQLSIAELSLRQWLRAGNFAVPKTNELDRFNRFQLSTGLKVSNDLVSLRPFALVLDETSIDGRVDLQLNPLNIDLELLADMLNLDHYLPTESDANSRQSDLSPVLLGTYKIDLGSLIINQRELTDVGVDLGIGADEVTFGRLDANLFGGELRAAGTHLIAPQITNLTGTVNGVQLSQFQFARPLDSISGSLQTTFDLRAAGRTQDEMMTSVSGPVRAKIANAFLGPLNVSDVICQTVASERNLSANTADTLALTADFQEGIAVIESIKATVANIAIQGKGRISLVSTASNIQGSIEIPNDGVIGSCTAPKVLNGVSLPLSCRGQLQNESLQCSLDEKALNQLIAKAAGKELRKQADEKVKAAEQQLKLSVEEVIKKKLDTEGSNLLKNLLNR